MNVYEAVTKEITSHLQNGVIPWRKQWRTAGPQVPTNFVTGKAYRGCNTLLLAWTNHTTDQWLTYKQAQSIGAQVRKGEKSRSIVFWSIARKDGETTNTETGATESTESRYSFAKTYNVFNVDQCDGIPQALPIADTAPFDREAAADAIVSDYFARAGAPTLRHGGDRAFYAPLTDLIQVPEFSAFESADGYYSTLFHEMTHSTVDARRLGSDLRAKKFGDRDYAREELIAEFGAAFLCGESGVSNERGIANSAAYIAHWLKALENDQTLAVRAAQMAQRCADYILGREFAQATPATHEVAA